MKNFIIVSMLFVFTGLTGVSADTATGAVANDDTTTTEANTEVVIDVLANDTGSGTLEVTWTSDDTNGSTSFTSTWVIFMPASLFVWDASFNYTIVDWSGSTATWSVEISVEDTTLPILTLNWESTITIEIWDDYIDEWAEFSDNVDWTWSVTASGEVDEDTEWTYTLSYDHTDTSWNEWVQISRTVIVEDTSSEDDTEAPVIILLWESTITIEIWDDYIDEWAEFSDNVDWTWSVTASGEVDEDTEWTYTLTYDYTDIAWNVWIQIFRTVIVREEDDNDDDNGDDDDGDDNDDDDNDDDDSKTVREIQKEFIAAFNILKAEYPGRARSSREYKEAKKDLFDEYKDRLKEATKQAREKIKDKREDTREKIKDKREDIRERIKTKREETRLEYKETFERKYGRMISNLSDEKLEILIDRIDALAVTINESNRTEESKERLLDLLAALRSLADNALNDIDSDEDLIKWIFENL